MPDFNENYQFSKLEKKYIEKLKKGNNYSHKKWDNLDDNDLKSIKENIRKFYRTLQKNLCYYCKKPLSSRTAKDCQIEHILPKSSYIDFMFETKNMCLICADCNEFKSSTDVSTGEEAKRYPRSTDRFKIVHPVFDDYNKYIRNEGKFYHGLDDCRKGKGSYTIHTYRLTRQLDDSKYTPEYYTEPEFLGKAEKISSKGKGDATIEMLLSKASNLPKEDKITLIQKLMEELK